MIRSAKRGGVFRIDCLRVTVEVARIGRLHAERRKRIAELRDRLPIWSRTAGVHCGGVTLFHRQETSIGIETQRKKEHDESAG